MPPSNLPLLKPRFAALLVLNVCVLTFDPAAHRHFVLRLFYPAFSSFCVCPVTVFQEVEGGVGEIAETLLEQVLRPFESELDLSSMEKRVADDKAGQ